MQGADDGDVIHEEAARERLSTSSADTTTAAAAPSRHATFCAIMSEVTFTRSLGMSDWLNGGGVSGTPRPAASANYDTEANIDFQSWQTRVVGVCCLIMALAGTVMSETPAILLHTVRLHVS